jgi:hypothetical protein
MKMIKYRGQLFDRRVLFLGVAFIVCSFTASGVSSSITQVRSEVHKELANILSVVQVKANPDLAMESVPGWTVLQVFTPDRKHSAYLICVPLKSKEDPERCAHRVYFDDYIGPAKIFEIRGEPELEEVTRPIDDLKWVNAFTLSYERWAGPHFGHRYLIDVRSRKQVAAYDLFSR